MRIFVYISVVYIMAIGLHSQPIPNEDIFQINTYTTGSQSEIEPLIDGGFVVCWIGYNKEELLNVYARIFNPDGSSRGVEFQVNSDTLIDFKIPTVAGLPDGGFVICWTQYNSETKTVDIIGQFFTAQGSQKGKEFQVNLELEPENNHWMAIAGLNGGGFLCLWRSQLPGPIYNHGYICGQIINGNGERIGNEFILPKQTDEDNYLPRLISLADGSLFACWETVIQTDTGGVNITGQLFESDGNRLGDVFTVKEGGFEADCSALEDGGFAVLWKEESEDEWFEQYVKYFNSNGSSRTSAKLINKFDEDDFPVYLGNIIGMEDGGVIACWDHEKSDEEFPSINFQLVDKDGNLRGTDFPVAKGATEPRTCRLPDNGFVICWTSNPWEFNNISAKIFREENHILQTFSLLEPIDDLVISVIPPVLKWQKPSIMKLNFPWEIVYTQYLDEDETFSSPTIIDSIYDTTYTVQNLTPGTTYFWKVLAKNIAGDSLWSTETNAFFVDWNATEIKNIDINQPKVFKLYQNYPNPFNPKTIINYELPITNFVKIIVYDINGRKVETLVDKQQPAGRYSVTFNGNNLASGVYFFQIQMGGYRETKKMILLR